MTRLESYEPPLEVRSIALAPSGRFAAAVIQDHVRRRIRCWDAEGRITDFDDVPGLVALRPGGADDEICAIGVYEGSAWLRLWTPSSDRRLDLGRARGVRIGIAPWSDHRVAVSILGDSSARVVIAGHDGDPKILFDRGGHLVPEVWHDTMIICSSRRGADDVRLYTLDSAGAVERFAVGQSPGEVKVVGADEERGVLALGRHGSRWRHLAWLRQEGDTIPFAWLEGHDIDLADLGHDGAVVGFNVDGGSETWLHDLDGRRRELLGNPSGTRRVVMASRGTAFLSWEARPRVPGLLTFIEGASRRELLRPQVEFSPIAEPKRTHCFGAPVLRYQLRAGGPRLLAFHGGPSAQWRRDYALGGLVQYLAAKGWTVDLVDPPGSTGFGEEYECALQTGMLSATQQWCAEAALKLNSIEQPLAVLGFSYGALIALELASTATRIAACIAVGAPVDLAAVHRQLAVEFGTAADRFIGDVSQASAAFDRYSLAETPMLFLHAADDRVIDPAPVRALVARRNKNGVASRLNEIPGSGHSLDQPGVSHVVLRTRE